MLNDLKTRMDEVRVRYESQLKRRLEAIMDVGTAEQVNSVQAQIDSSEAFFALLLDSDPSSAEIMMTMIDGQIATLAALEGLNHKHRAAILDEGITLAVTIVKNGIPISVDPRFSICASCQSLYFNGPVDYKHE